MMTMLSNVRGALLMSGGLTRIAVNEVTRLSRARDRKRRPISGTAAGYAAGFTLLEALVVLAIIAMATVIAAPSPGVLRSNQARLLATGILADLRTLHDDALRNGSLTALLVSKDGYELSPAKIRRRIPDGATIDVRLQDDFLLRPGAADPLQFHSDGSSNGMTVTLSLGATRSVILVNGLDGMVKFESDR